NKSRRGNNNKENKGNKIQLNGRNNVKLSIDELGETLPGTKFSIYESEGENKTSVSNSNSDTLSNEMISKLENHYGTTNNYNVAGYLLTDGKMLDFS
ncbi:MAG: hypothetical protein ACI4RI_03135, partial [Ruminococcus sp.]